MRRFAFISVLSLVLLSASSLGARAQKDSLKVLINDYSMLGLQYGVSLANADFNPVRTSENMFCPVNVGIMYTKYCKMFGYMPYFGVRVGLFYTQEGYHFKENEKTGYTDAILGAQTARYKTVELPILAHFHVDFWKMKIMLDIGPYAGYRFDMRRSEYVSDYYYQKYKDYENSFHPNEYRFDYGLKGGAGFALVFDPVEIHFMGYYKFAFQTIHQPDVNAISLERDEKSSYYYKWCYPTNLIFALGVHYQLSRREGYTRKQLKQQAFEEASLIYKKALETLQESEQKQDSLDLVEGKFIEKNIVDDEKIDSQSR